MVVLAQAYLELQSQLSQTGMYGATTTSATLSTSTMVTPKPSRSPTCDGHSGSESEGGDEDDDKMRVRGTCTFR